MQAVVDDLKQKLLNPAFTKYRNDVQLITEQDQDEPTGPTGPKDKETVIAEDEENFMEWLERLGRIKSWAISTELLTGICNQLATYGPPPADTSTTRNEILRDWRRERPVSESALDALILYHRYYQHRGQALLAQISETMFDVDDPDGLQLRLAVEIVHQRKAVKKMRQRIKRSKASKNKSSKTTLMGVPVSLPPPPKAQPIFYPNNTPEQRLARKREVLEYAAAYTSNKNRKDTFDQWLEGS